MKSACLSLLLLAGIVSGFSQEAKPPTSVYYARKVDLLTYLPNADDEIILLGNSITDGGNWGELLHDQRVKNRGVSGDVTRGILNRLDEVIEAHPLQIFLLIGINDLSKGASQANILENIQTMIRRTRDTTPETEILIQSVLPVNPAYDRYPKHVSKSREVILLNKALVQLCDSLQLTYIDLYPHFVNAEGCLRPEYTNDGLHLSGAGYMVWRDILRPYLAKKPGLLTRVKTAFQSGN